jgi:hypothetical protein
VQTQLRINVDTRSVRYDNEPYRKQEVLQSLADRIVQRTIDRFPETVTPLGRTTTRASPPARREVTGEDILRGRPVRPTEPAAKSFFPSWQWGPDVSHANLAQIAGSVTSDSWTGLRRPIVRAKGAAGRSWPLTRLQNGPRDQPYRTASGSRRLSARTSTVSPTIAAVAGTKRRDASAIVKPSVWHRRFQSTLCVLDNRRTIVSPRTSCEASVGP